VRSNEIEPEPASLSSLFPADRLPLARAFVAALGGDGVVRGLIGPREPGRLWTRHVLNSVVVAPLVPPDARVVDVGTGAGLPGIPLAIARPDLRVDLVEPLERRTTFLSEMVDVLGLTRCRVVRGRAEDVIDIVGGADVVTSRAVAPLGKLGGWSAPLARPGGLLLALKGASAAVEVERDAAALRAAGLSGIEVRTLGEGIIDPVTYVVRATITGRPAPSPARRKRPHR
jgi:16S rRNA (guanine527-N7)-methyltransferase